MSLFDYIYMQDQKNWIHLTGHIVLIIGTKLCERND